MMDRYSEFDEISFIRSLLRMKKVELARRYCRLILTQPRRWDPTVKMPALASYATRVLAGEIEIEPAPPPVPASVLPSDLP